MAKTHRMSRTPEYDAWAQMRQRCFNPNHKSYSNYGDRGITVCDRWLNFENFITDMGSRPTAKHSIDRIDNNGDYQKDNCRWATRKDQADNRRSNRFITIGCVTLNVTQWTKEMGFGKGVIYTRLNLGWSELKAVTTPLRSKR